jgi:hypothetical protein
MHNDKISVKLGVAEAVWEGSVLRMDTGAAVRRWRLTSKGLQTLSLARAGGREWIEPDRLERDGCDWFIWGFHQRSFRAELRDVTIAPVTGDPLGSDRIEAVFVFEYPDVALGLRYRIWAYPAAPGLRTQVGLRLLRPGDPRENPVPTAREGSVVEGLAVDVPACERLAAGFYTDPQHRNRAECPMLKEERREGPLAGRLEVYDWANLLTLTRGPEALALVKESHKCVNNAGMDTGEFVLGAEGVRVTGIGLNNTASQWYGRPCDALGENFRDGWATWSVVSGDGQEGCRLTVKRFDRLRFHPRAEVDLRIRANTWGTRKDPGEGARAACFEDNIRREIDSCAEIGVDSLTLDDGWQHDPRGCKFTPPGTSPTTPHPERFPGGWAPICRYAADKGVKLALHFSHDTALEDLTRNYDEGGFCDYKVDFAYYTRRSELDDALDKARRLSAYTGHRLRISWDLTENMTRIGYYIGREFGAIYLENRNTDCFNGFCGEPHCGYVPWLVLRDAWHLAHWINLNQIEVTVQNPELFRDAYSRAFSDAAAHTPAYCAAIAFMALPQFFQETQFYSAAARAELRRLLAIYKEHRRAIYDGYVFPIGAEPDNASWTGFQSHQPETGSGYLTLFREVHNQESEHEIALGFLGGRTVRLTNLLRQETTTAALNPEGRLRFRIDKPADFRFYRYDVLSQKEKV